MLKGWIMFCSTPVYLVLLYQGSSMVLTSNDLVKSQQIWEWALTDIWAAVSVTQIAPWNPYNHAYFVFPLVAIAYACKKCCSQGVCARYVHAGAIVVIAITVSLCQWESSFRAHCTLASSWSAGGRASGSEASNSKSKAHMAGPGGGGSGGALLNFIGMLSWSSAFSHKASPSGISQPERPLHT